MHWSQERMVNIRLWTRTQKEDGGIYRRDLHEETPDNESSYMKYECSHMKVAICRVVDRRNTGTR